MDEAQVRCAHLIWLSLWTLTPSDKPLNLVALMCPDCGALKPYGRTPAQVAQPATSQLVESRRLKEED